MLQNSIPSLMHVARGLFLKMIQNINVQKNNRKSNANRCCALFAHLALLPGFDF